MIISFLDFPLIMIIQILKAFTTLIKFLESSEISSLFLIDTPHPLPALIQLLINIINNTSKFDPFH